MSDWKTTLFGFGAAILPWVKSVWPEGAVLVDAATSFAVALFAWFARDRG